jgi:hypothetical protein
MIGGRQAPKSDHDRWAASSAYKTVFEGGPPRRLTALVFLPAPICRRESQRVLLVVLLGWMPLAILTAATPAAIASFLRDFGIHARLAIAAPLLVVGYSVCADRLGVIALHFLGSGLLDDEGRARFVAELTFTRRLLNSLWAEAVTVLIAYAIAFVILNGGSGLFVQAAWQRGVDGTSLSPAGWWNALVGTPLLFMLLIGWVWRIAMWSRFLRIVARLDLRLIAAHPDQAGGLGFLTQSVRAFAVLGMALGSISAGRFAQVYAVGQATQFTSGLLIGGTAVLAILFFVGPLLWFSAPLIRCWRNGTVAYGGLASDLGQQFEQRWFAETREIGPDILGEPDFSATVDLYGVVSNVYAMRFVPVELRSIFILLGATLAPFIPAMFLSLPIDILLGELKGLLF